MRLFIFVLGGFIAACSNPQVLLQSSKASHLTIDGQLSDWKNIFQSATNPTVRYAIQNDQSHLYLALETEDIHLIRQLGIGGLKVTFDGGKEYGKTALIYPLGRMNGGIVPPVTPSEGGGYQFPLMDSRQAEQYIKRLLHLPTEFEVITDALPDGKRLSTLENSGISVQSVFENGKFSYELKMPLKAYGVAEYATGFSAQNQIVLQINSGGWGDARPRNPLSEGARLEGDLRPRHGAASSRPLQIQASIALSL